MYLNILQIKNYRGISNLSLAFNDGLNVIIGENNTCKTTLLDALRLCFNIGALQRENIFVSREDFYVDISSGRANEIEFDLIFADLNDEEKGVYYEMITRQGEEITLQFHVRYLWTIKNGMEKIIFRLWGGEHEGQAVASETLQLLNSVYLSALRDAEKDLAPKKGSKLGQLFIKVLDDEKQQQKYADKLNDSFRQDGDWQNLIEKAKKTINAHLNKTLMGDFSQSVEIKLVPQEFKKIVEGLKIHLPYGAVDKTTIITKFQANDAWKAFFDNPEQDNTLLFKDNFLELLEGDNVLEADLKIFLKQCFDDSLFEIDQNGLGFNNLIYIATVLGDLLERKKSEPEAFFVLIIEEPEAHLHPQLQDVLFRYFEELQINGKIQIFISSHSPTITAKTELDSLIILTKEDFQVSSLNVKNCPLQPKDKKYLERFLDVTKCRLFFAKGVIFVEGISEALIFPLLAEALQYDLDKSGIEVINISGLAFKPFGLLFNERDKNKRLDRRAAIISDDDNLPDSERVTNLHSLAGEKLKVYIASNTLEAELFNAGNGQLMFELYKTIHPQFDSNNTRHDALEDFLNKIRSNKDKAEFNQLLSFNLKENPNNLKSFRVPEYFRKSLKWVIEGKDA